MDALEALISRLPESAELIRQRFWRDAEFRTVCEDYRDAQEALRRLEVSAPSTAPALDDYRALLRQLLAEAIEILEEDSGCGCKRR